jgi:hypothetical protein
VTAQRREWRSRDAASSKAWSMKNGGMRSVPIMRGLSIAGCPSAPDWTKNRGRHSGRGRGFRLKIGDRFERTTPLGFATADGQRRNGKPVRPANVDRIGSNQSPSRPSAEGGIGVRERGRHPPIREQADGIRRSVVALLVANRVRPRAECHDVAARDRRCRRRRGGRLCRGEPTDGQQSASNDASDLQGESSGACRVESGRRSNYIRTNLTPERLWRNCASAKREASAAAFVRWPTL